MSPGPADGEKGRKDPATRWAHRVDPDLAAEREGAAPPASGKPPISARPPGASRYGWFVGVLVVLILGYISVNTLRTGSGARGLAPGRPLPAFAVPLVGSDLTGDANLAGRPGKGAGRTGRTPACEVTDPRALNICQVAGRRPVVVAFFSEKNDASIRQLDVMQAVSRRVPAVRYVAVALKGDRSRLRTLVERHGWTFPVGWDRQGDVAAVYFVPDLPALTFARPGRVVARAVFHAEDERMLESEVRALARPTPATGRR
jgi:hypothetical protein